MTTALVAKTPGAITYAEKDYANKVKLPVAKVLNNMDIAVQPGGKISLGGGSVVQTATYVVGGSGTAPRRTSPAPLTSSEIIP